MSLTDESLVARVVATGDQHAFATLVRRHQSSVRSRLRQLCAGDVATADDLAQEVFLKAYRNLGSWRAEAPFSSWLGAIAHRTFLSHARLARSRFERPGDVEDPENEAPGEQARALARHDVQKAMTGLRAEERVALALTFGEDLTHEEAAARLEWPVGTLKTHVLRAKEKLRRRLGAWRGQHE